MSSAVHTPFADSSSQTLPFYRFIIWSCLASIGAATLYATYKLILYPRYLSPLRKIPGPPLGDILSGQFPAILQGEAGIPQRQWVKDYGPVVRVVGPIGIERLIFANDSALHKILCIDWIDYPRPNFLRHILGLLAGYGLLTVTGNAHKQMRRVMNPAFTSLSLMARSPYLLFDSVLETDQYYDSINGLLDILQEDIDSVEKPNAGKIIHMYEWMSKVTLDIICETAFGYTADSLHNPDHELARAYHNLSSLQNGRNLALLIAAMIVPGMHKVLTSDWAYRHRGLLSMIPCYGPIKTTLESMHSINRVSTHLLEEKMRDAALAATNTEGKQDVLSLLIRARKQDVDQSDGSYTMSNYDIVQHVLSFLGAGHETVASGLTWTLWLLAGDLECQAKLRREVSPLFAKEGARPDYMALKGLRWLDCVIMESLRILPPIPMTFRITGKTDYIDGVLVPKGTMLYIPIRVVNPRKEIWGEDAEEFKPARWLDLPPKYTAMPSTLSFLVGPHVCIGKAMAMIEMKAVLAALIARFEFEPAFEGQTVTPTAAITMKPKDGLPLRVRAVKHT